MRSRLHIRSTAVWGGVFAVILTTFLLPSVAEARRTACADAYYRYKEHGTHQYVLASEIKARGVTCSEARRLGRAYGKGYRRDYEPPTHLLGFTCEWTRIGSDVGSGTCKAGQTQVKFSIYDSSPYH